MMRLGMITVLVVAAGLGCGKSTKEQLKEDMEKEHARNPDPEPAPDPVRKPVDPPTEKKKEEPIPEPTTPEEIDNARKQAMIDGRDKDVVRFCEMGKYEEKGDPQVMLGCTLAACRINDPDKAKQWAKSVTKSKPLYDQAIKTCMANKVVL